MAKDKPKSDQCVIAARKGSRGKELRGKPAPGKSQTKALKKLSAFAAEKQAMVVDDEDTKQDEFDEEDNRSKVQKYCGHNVGGKNLRFDSDDDDEEEEEDTDKDEEVSEEEEGEGKVCIDNIENTISKRIALFKTSFATGYAKAPPKAAMSDDDLELKKWRSAYSKKERIVKEFNVRGYKDSQWENVISKIDNIHSFLADVMMLQDPACNSFCNAKYRWRIEGSFVLDSQNQACALFSLSEA
jgi:hypothetical protein